MKEGTHQTTTVSECELEQPSPCRQYHQGQQDTYCRGNPCCCQCGSCARRLLPLGKKLSLALFLLVVTVLRQASASVHAGSSYAFAATKSQAITAFAGIEANRRKTFDISKSSGKQCTGRFMHLHPPKVSSRVLLGLSRGCIDPSNQEAHDEDLDETAAMDNSNDDAVRLSDRRQFFSFTKTAAAAALAMGLFSGPSKAEARRGLVQFPCNDPDYPLANTYHFLRVGTTLFEEQDIYSTNPLFLTNREDALSPTTGVEQIVAACAQMAGSQDFPTVVKYSLAAASIDTANIVGRELRLGRDRLVPEFTFLDPRAIGAWDMLSYQAVNKAVAALDHDFAGTDGTGSASRPPPNEDGTPHETLQDQAVRLRQIMSILETQYSGDTILLVFRDGTGPALLSCMMAGIPYSAAHVLDFAPGELRRNVNYQSVRALYEERVSSAEFQTQYQAMLEQGRKELQALQSQTTPFVNLKDQMIEAERLEIDREMERRAAARLQAAAQKQKDAEDEARAVLQQRQQRSSASGGGGNEIPAPFLALGAAALVGVAGATVPQPSQEQQRQQEEARAANLNLVAPGGANNSNNSNMTETTLYSSSVGLYGNDDNDSSSNMYQQSQSLRRINGDLLSTKSPFTAPVITDPYERAQQAMQEYLDRDDGYEDWLASVAQIMNEPDTVEDVGVDTGNNNNDDAAMTVQNAPQQEFSPQPRQQQPERSQSIDPSAAAAAEDTLGDDSNWDDSTPFQ